MKKEMTLAQLISGYVILCFLLAAALVVPALHLGAAASFIVAILKMITIVTIFMRLFVGSRLYTMAFALGIVFLLLLVIGTSFDLFSRPL